MKRFLVRVLIGLSVATPLAAGGLAAWLWTSLPHTDTTLDVDGLTAPVEVMRDSAGVPHIFAEADTDAYFALGFVHAQDRFWQMEVMRRFGAGRLSEIFGADALATDKWMRTLGLYRLAEKEVADLPEPVRAAVDAYAYGVNAWLEDQLGLPALEFALTLTRPEAWKAADSLVWGKIMAMRLSGNWRDEGLRARIAKRIQPKRVGQLWPAYPDDAPVSIAEIPEHLSDALAQVAELAPWPQGGPRGASNMWAVHKSKTSTEGAILANDPHLGFQAPILWYLARLEAPGLKVSGATVPGVPFTILGHNARIAWGVTSTQSDLTDLFVEQLDRNDPERYETQDGTRPFYRRDEVIGVKGGEEVTITVRRSHHGPVISDLMPDLAALGAGTHVIALAATYLAPGDQTPVALYGLNRASSWETFVEALKEFHSPQQNFAYADTSGNIGFLAPGRVPVRDGGKGLVPSPGWSGETDWQGFIPFDDLPKAYNPDAGWLINANNRPVSGDYPHFLGFDWAAPYRAQRIADVLGETQPHSLETSAKLQRDALSTMAKDLLPLMLAFEPDTGLQMEVVNMLKAWNGEMSRRRPEPLIFAHWLLQLNRAVYADELGDLTNAYLTLRPGFIKSVMTRRLAWCDDITTENTVEICSERLKTSLKRALQALTERHGPAPAAWRWSAEHVARFDHPLFSRLPLLNLMGSLAIETDGGNYTVNRGAGRPNNAAAPFAHVHGAGYRAVYDLADLERSRFIIATGQSGNPLSEHYSDLLGSWRDGGFRRLNAKRGVMSDNKADTLRFEPVGWQAPGAEETSGAMDFLHTLSNTAQDLWKMAREQFEKL